ncbi:hypothetical protein BV25DRAFT_1432651 [Artomyces pyxidatus]|uniref:Uncharacterized protein n=1 Tax=Artomyces pyxidatus TaxID=48021 RepID=A0ACB8SMB1_9AGAM|nr:hypothetical protein BV25DRAFT_1432651 [Artomyces pyxidatus]
MRSWPFMSISTCQSHSLWKTGDASKSRKSSRHLQAQPLQELLFRLRAITSGVYHPLALLRPHRNSSTNHLNLRVFWCGMHFFLSNLGFGYSLYVLMTYLAFVLKYTPIDSGYALTAASVSSVFSLFVLTPCLVKYVRPLFEARKIHRLEDAESTTGTPDAVSSGTQFEVHIAAMGWAMAIIAMLGVPFAGSRMQIILVEPLRSVGAALSTVLLRFVLGTTISTHPSTVFWVYAAIETMAIGTLYCIRDGDRYIPQAPAEE